MSYLLIFSDMVLLTLLTLAYHAEVSSAFSALWDLRNMLSLNPEFRSRRTNTILIANTKRLHTRLDNSFPSVLFSWPIIDYRRLACKRPRYFIA